MSKSKARPEKTTYITMSIPDSLKTRIRRFRAIQELNGTPISSDVKAIILLTDKALTNPQ